MQIKTVAVLGAGAVGSYVIYGLSDVPGVELGVIAEGERAARYRQNGCRINDTVYHPAVWTPAEAHGVDLLIVCLKYGALRGALDSIRQVVGENTLVMSLMNGIDSEEIIGTAIDPGHIIYSLIKVASQGRDGGYYFDPETTLGIILGELQPPYRSERIQAIDELFAKSRLHYTITEHIREEMWSKFRLNVCNNLPQAILGCGVGCYHDSEYMDAIRKGLRTELETIAAAQGIDLSVVDKGMSKGSKVPPTARYSTLQDLDNHRHTEIDMFSGALIRLGKELHIPTPYNEYTYYMIKALEQKNDGLFAY